MIVVHDEVARALADGGPVVALETTLVTHGLPHPRGVETGLRLEAAVREEGATPATVGVLEGRVRVGLSADDLHALATSAPQKIQAGGLALALAGGASGGTTVSATILMAARCGIRVFATGGIGGVHRDVHRSGDISEDLAALAHAPVAVVSSGAKAILDLARTLEALETWGVPVVGYQTDEFPAFYHGRSGLRVERAGDVETVVRIMRHQWQTLRLDRAVLVANPPPAASALPPAEVERLIGAALSEAAALGIGGKALTPHLLASLERASAGGTVRTNVALVESNARLAARLAVGYAAATR